MAKTNINKEFNINDYKEDIDKYVKERVEKESSSTLIKFYKKKLRNKSIMIFIEFVLILILLGGGVVGFYYLYNDGYFNKYGSIIKKSEKPVNNEPINNNNNNNTNNKQDENDKLESLVRKYSYLLDNVIIDTKTDYLTEFFSGNITNELKEYLAFQIINKTYITSDGSSSYFDAEILKRAYKELFGENIEFTNFKVNGAHYKYLKNKDLFISTTLSTNGNKIEREITNIEEKGNLVTITTTEGYIKNNKLYNILSNKEIKDYKKNDKLSKYTKKLNVVKYTFNKDILVGIK